MQASRRAIGGVHGCYRALAEGDADSVGATIHLLDEGIDTGPIIAQRRFAVTHEDSFVTYPYLHAAATLPLATHYARCEVAKGFGISRTLGYLSGNLERNGVTNVEAFDLALGDRGGVMSLVSGRQGDQKTPS